MNTEQIIELGREAVRTEIEGLEGVVSQLDESFARAVRIVAELKGKVILTGVGKSGIIARKIASTMVSIGTPAVFMHPVDGLHGDLGTIMPQDAAVVLSNSGNTHEIIDLLAPLKSLGIPIIAITGNTESPLARQADVTLSCTVSREACNLGLAPTASTTAQLAVGDALAVVLSHIKGFDRDAFKLIHPAGELGKQLMFRISQIMITGDRIPIIQPEALLDEVIVEMTNKSLGFTLVGDTDRVEGIITDGDLRRVLLKRMDNLKELTARDIMSPKPKTITGDMLALDALDMMEKNQITSLVVSDGAQGFLGVVHLHDLLGRGKLGLRGV
ncbi:MAG: Arabinose 5-phosphate isomerase KdsD [Deltaproteobacteria bacterium ADurb.BinA179]|jgi:arabinose-5-phosphate isomerase|nr:KpsF/GutQ family sugar-phosphate isomerase [Deltaproteobacteria bacterium]MDI9543420.1 KpsF/GutQ family sugar-phosphate isomerase [Pseudomonadota bacterium]OPZ30206.1 MAG: Arabinose 5-phosphate isomerase KdsD [Deltaproteobacteria bacterium ADurb.BinA179]HRR20229.1 KpsF/GutQ family sugar-phosphate isomerase [Desulfomonilia bacterium]HNU73681.1 KpsF/GutQ family sugar-phosphate isomerase [Deltaproteobacteria bacterium]